MQDELYSFKHAVATSTCKYRPAPVGIHMVGVFFALRMAPRSLWPQDLPHG